MPTDSPPTDPPESATPAPAPSGWCLFARCTDATIDEELLGDVAGIIRVCALRGDGRAGMWVLVLVLVLVLQPSFVLVLVLVLLVLVLVLLEELVRKVACAGVCVGEGCTVWQLRRACWQKICCLVDKITYNVSQIIFEGPTARTNLIPSTTETTDTLEWCS